MELDGAMKMTVTRLASLKGSDKRQAFRDDTVPGLTLYVEPAPRATKTWYWRGRIAGTVVTHKLGRFPAHSYAAARQWALEIGSFRDLGRDIVAERDAEAAEKAERQKRTGQWLFELWLDQDCRRRNKQSTIASKRAMWDRDLKAPLGEMDIQAIEFETLDDIVIDKAKSAPTQANRLVAFLSRMFRWSTKQGRRQTGLTSNPAANLYKPGRERKRTRVLADYEIGYLLTVLESSRCVAAPAIQLILETGVRRGEALGARWSELDLRSRDWVLPGGERTKNGSIFVIPLMDRTVSLFSKQPRSNSSDLVFWSRATPERHMSGTTKFHAGIFSAMKVLAEADGRSLEWWTLHDLRRTMATKMSGFRDSRDRPLVPPHVVDACLNHVSGSAKGGVAGVYNHHQYYAEKKSAFRLWHAHLENCAKQERRRRMPRSALPQCFDDAVRGPAKKLGAARSTELAQRASRAPAN